MLIALLGLLAAPAAAHAGEEAPPDQGALAPLAAPFGEPGSPVRSGDLTVKAWRTGDGHLAFETFTVAPGWVAIAVDEPGERASAMHNTPVNLDLFETVVAHVTPAGEVSVATGTYAVPTSINSISLSPGTRSVQDHSEHLAQWDEGFLSMDRTTNPYVRAEAQPVGHGEFRLTVYLPEDAARLQPGSVTPVLAFAGDDPQMPRSPFLEQTVDGAGSFFMYPARAMESAQDAERAARALARDAEPTAGILTAAGTSVAILAGIALAGASGEGLAGRRPVASGRHWLEALLAPAAGRSGAAGRALVLAALLLVSPAWAPTATAAAEDPENWGPPVREAGDVRDPCTEDAPVRRYNVSAIDLEIIYNRWGDKDPEGMMYVLDEDIPDVLAERERMEDLDEFPTGAEPSLITPLVLRARLGECLEIRFTNRLNPDPDRPDAPDPFDPAEDPDFDDPRHPDGTEAGKVPETALPLEPYAERRASIHVHGLSVDPLADGSGAVGRNPDSTVPPNASRTYRVSASFEGIFFMHDHGDPTSAGQESFSNLEDHFRGGTAHGLFGAVVVEPPGAMWTDPYTGEPLTTGWRADIHVPGEESFREFVIFYHDPQLVAANGNPIDEPMTDHGLNYRVETLSHRIFDDTDRCSGGANESNNGVNPCKDVSLVYSSNVHGDPGTPIPRAYTGDKVKFRLAHAGMEETHVHHVHGHRWREIDGKEDAARIDSQTLSPGETWTQTLEGGAGGQSRGTIAGDYIFHCHLFPHLYGGMWGIFRVHDHREADLQPLPTRTPPPEPTPDDPGFPGYMFNQTPGHRPFRAPQEVGIDPRTGMNVTAVGAPYADPCPETAPVRRYRLAAIEVPVKFNGHGDYDPAARIYAFAEDADDIREGRKNPDPVVLRVQEGECLVVHLENRFPMDARPETDIEGFGKVSIHPHLMAFDVHGTDGLSTGWNYDTGIWPGESITYRYYADTDIQTVVWHDHANGLEKAFRGIYGATIVEPPGADWRNPETGGPVYTTGDDRGDGAYDSVYDPEHGEYADVWRADIVGEDFEDFREFFASVQDFVTAFPEGETEIPYRPQECPECFGDFGLMGFNYRSEPLFHRLGHGMENVFNSSAHGDPATNLWEAYPGDPVVVRFHQVAYEEMHTLTLDGHRWRFGYKDPDSRITDTFTVGVSEAFNAYLECGAGGCANAPGDYLYRGGSIDDYWAGAWGIFRVHDGPTENLTPLPDREEVRYKAKPVCPPDAPTRWFDVHAIEKEILYNAYGDHDPNGLMYVLAHEKEAVEHGDQRPEPLVLRVEPGDCVKVKLTNSIPPDRIPLGHSVPQPTGGFVAPFTGPFATVGELLSVRPYEPGDRVGLHPHLLTYDPQESDGARIGYNHDTTVGYGETRVYTFHADLPAGTAALLEDMGDIVTNRKHGLFGAVIVEPEGHDVLDPKTGFPDPNRPVADVSKDGRAWREAVLFGQSGIPLVNSKGRPVSIAGHGGGVDAEEAGEAALDALKDLTPGGDDRAYIEVVHLNAPGFLVEGHLEDRRFQVQVNREGEIEGMKFSQSRESFPAHRSLRVTDALGQPVEGLDVVLERTGEDEDATTGADGTANFTRRLIPETLSILRIEGVNFRIPVRAGFDGGFHLDLRTGPGGYPNASLAANLALTFVRDHKFPASPPGISAVDVTQRVWRVTVEDALRVYHVDIDPYTRQIVSFAFEAHAEASGPPAYLSEGDVLRAAERFLEKHYLRPAGDGAPGRSDLLAEFEPHDVNEWWVQTRVNLAPDSDSDREVSRVEARISGGPWETLTLRDWGSWAASLHVPEGSLVEFRATTSDGSQALSGKYAWPDGTLIEPAPPVAKGTSRTPATADLGEPVAKRLDRFGAWRVEYHHSDEGIATSLRVDGQTGRILAFVRAPAAPFAGGAPLPDGAVGVRVLGEGGTDPQGELAIVDVEQDKEFITGLRAGGRLALTPRTLEDANHLGEVLLKMPTLGFAAPLEARPDEGGVEIDIADVRSMAIVKPRLALEQAIRYFEGFTPLEEPGEHEGHVPEWALTGLDLRGDGAWHVAIALDTYRVDVRVDAATGSALGATVRPWETPEDRCSGEPLEHLGPHPSPQCPNGWSHHDEEDQGAKGFNYRSEPYVNRLVDEPDPALVYSSRAHRDPATPLIEAYPHDPVRIHLLGIQDKGRQTAFMVSGHVWPRQPGDPHVSLRQAEGGIGPYRTFRLDLVGGAGGTSGLDGDYLYQGAVQRLHPELGEWGILRVHGERTPTLRALDDAPSMPPTSGSRHDDCRMPEAHHLRFIVTTTSDGLLQLEPLTREGRVIAPAGQVTVILVHLVDEDGRSVHTKGLTIQGPGPWATGTRLGSSSVCMVLEPPEEAAGTFATFHLGGRVGSTPVATVFSIDVEGDQADSNPLDRDTEALETPAPSVLLALLAAGTLGLCRRRPSRR